MKTIIFKELKYFTLIFVSLFFVFTACDDNNQFRETACNQENTFPEDRAPGSLCSDELCTEYFAIWKELIMEKNNLSQDFFDSHIELINSNLSTWASGISFGVCYKFNVGWATAFNCDAFIININADNTLFPALDLPRDTFLTKEKIKIAIDNAAFSSAITAVNNVENLKHANLEASLADLIDFSDVNLLCLNSINLDEKTGNLTLKASAQYVNEFNSCIQGTIDLITGDKNVNDTPCFIN
jgi:hypothetical protein